MAAAANPDIRTNLNLSRGEVVCAKFRPIDIVRHIVEKDVMDIMSIVEPEFERLIPANAAKIMNLDAPAHLNRGRTNIAQPAEGERDIVSCERLPTGKNRNRVERNRPANGKRAVCDAFLQKAGNINSGDREDGAVNDAIGGDAVRHQWIPKTQIAILRAGCNILERQLFLVVSVCILTNQLMVLNRQNASIPHVSACNHALVKRAKLRIQCVFPKCNQRLVHRRQLPCFPKIVP